jgi:hypothetical protein
MDKTGAIWYILKIKKEGAKKKGKSRDLPFE